MPKINKYNLQARIFPTILCVLPLLIFQYFFINEQIAIFLKYLGGVEFVGNVAISSASIYFVSQVNRIISKTFFEKSLEYMPTTNLLLFSNSEYSRSHKKKIYSKLERDFEVRLPNGKEQDENELDSRKRISEVVGLAKKRVGEGKLLLQHNIEYGFWRNFLGGSTLGVVFSFIDIYFSYKIENNSVLAISSVLLLCYALSLIFSKFIINKVSDNYARVLFEEYLESNH
ncbi:MAG: hypothetical protein OEV93_01980 [Candidatus Moranbacteria bacterium]|nr:hypothetical protein [Candidatus Moranbacteria bacterium]